MNIVDQYAHTLFQASEEKSTKEFKIFFNKSMEYILKHNHRKALPAILRAVVRLAAAKQADKQTMLIVRQSDRASEYAKRIKKHSDLFSTDYRVVENEQIIGGFQLKNRTHLLDGSYRTRLIELYKRLLSV